MTTTLKRNGEETEAKQKVLEWACKKSKQEVQDRIDNLIGIAVDEKLEDGERLWAKFEATELVSILGRRGKTS